MGGFEFEFDVYVAYSSKDVGVVEAVAKKLRESGLRVWFDRWRIKAGHLIAQEIVRGVEKSRTALCCVSKNSIPKGSLDSWWPAFEISAFMGDPRKTGRRLVILRLDNSPLPGAIASFRHLEWFRRNRAKVYEDLLAACAGPQPRSTKSRGSASDAPAGVRSARSSDSPSPDHKTILRTSGKTIQLIHAGSRRKPLRLEGHGQRVECVAWRTDSKRALSGSRDGVVCVWDVETRRRLQMLKGHAGAVLCLAWSPDGGRAISGARDNTLRVWDLETGNCTHALHHDDWVTSAAWNATNPRFILTGCQDNQVRLWNLDSGLCVAVCQGHGEGIRAVTWFADQKGAISSDASLDIRAWDFASYVN